MICLQRFCHFLACIAQIVLLKLKPVGRLQCCSRLCAVVRPMIPRGPAVASARWLLVVWHPALMPLFFNRRLVIALALLLDSATPAAATAWLLVLHTEPSTQ